MKKILRIGLFVSLALTLSLAAFATAAAQEGDSIEACTGDSVSGTVVAVDEATGEITIELEDETLCTVQVSSGYEHPITSLLGTYFNDVSLEELSAELEALTVSLNCPEGESCTLAGEGEEGIEGTVISVTETGDGEYEVVIEYLDDEGNPTTTTIIVEDSELAETWTGALESLTVEWDLNQEDDGAFVNDAGDEIASLHEDGMGYGVIVKLFSMASDLADACDATDGDTEGDPEDTSVCDVSLDTLVEEFQSGTGLGQLFQQYGKPSLLGVGHVRKSLNGNGNTPPDTACGYWKQQPDLESDHPCYEVQQQWQNRGNGNGRGKPPWAGQPGGPNNQGGD
ncbi:MAG: hypothetical protein R3191_04165 [Anaerolineales bacterium]|nr:hypothetical protein [Anaerolineales bacterium]